MFAALKILFKITLQWLLSIASLWWWDEKFILLGFKTGKSPILHSFNDFRPYPGRPGPWPRRGRGLQTHPGRKPRRGRGLNILSGRGPGAGPEKWAGAAGPDNTDFFVKHEFYGKYPWLSLALNVFAHNDYFTYICNCIFSTSIVWRT